MQYKQFTRKLSEQQVWVEIKSQLRSHGHLIEQTSEDVILVDKAVTEFVSLEEARQFVKQQFELSLLEKELQQEMYEDLSESAIAKIIAETHDVKVTDKLIEQYVELAATKPFTTDVVVNEIRSLNKHDRLIEGKIDFNLDDNSIVAIDEEFYNYINNILESHKEIVEYMRESKENFLNVIKKLKE